MTLVASLRIDQLVPRVRSSVVGLAVVAAARSGKRGDEGTESPRGSRKRRHFMAPFAIHWRIEHSSVSPRCPGGGGIDQGSLTEVSRTMTLPHFASRATTRGSPLALFLFSRLS